MKLFPPKVMICLSCTLILILLLNTQVIQAYSYGYSWATNHTTYKYGSNLPTSFKAGNDYGGVVWNNVTKSSWVYAYNSSSSSFVDYVYIDGAGSVLTATSKTITNGQITFFKIEYDNSENWYTDTGTPGANQVDL